MKGAFDRVPRALLWEVLQRLGVHGTMLRAIQSLYRGVGLSMNVSGRTGTSVRSETGVKQGCPLSPTLFGLFCDGLHRYLAHRCPTLGPALTSGEHVPDLEYADDVTLLDGTAQGLQALLTAADAFFTQVGMIIEPAKTYIMVFGSGGPQQFVWVCGGQPLHVVDSGK